MTRTVVLIDSAAFGLGALGLTVLVRPAATRRLLRLEDSEAAGYALRIGGAMIFASALFLGGFATAFYLASAA